jgi:hypothetical protein
LQPENETVARRSGEAIPECDSSATRDSRIYSALPPSTGLR